MKLQSERDFAAKLLEQKGQIIERVLFRHLEFQPSIKERYTDIQYKQYRNDCSYHIDFLAESIMYNSPILYRDYLNWAYRLFHHLRIPADQVKVFFSIFHSEVSKYLSEDTEFLKSQYLSGIEDIKDDMYGDESFINDESFLGYEARRYLTLSLDGMGKQALDYIRGLVRGGLEVRDCYLHIFQPVQYEVGRLWHIGEISVAQEHYVSSTVQQSIAEFYPLILNKNSDSRIAVSACVSGEQHEIGLRMVTDLLEMDGWDTYYLGANSPPAGVTDMLYRKRAKLLLLSATISSHLSSLEQIIMYARMHAPHVKIMVGGHPFNLDKQLWQKLGADSFASNAEEALHEANRLVLEGFDARQ